MYIRRRMSGPEQVLVAPDGSYTQAFREASMSEQSIHFSPVRRWVIYTLEDPLSEEVRYVGWTFDIHTRYRTHLSGKERPHTHRARWIAKLLRQSLKPRWAEIESGVGEGWAEAEQRWIAHYRACGCRLTNATEGGEGVPGLKMSAETRAKLSSLKRGRKLSEEHRRKIAVANTGRIPSEECRRKIGIANSGKHLPTPERSRELAAIAKVRLNSPEAIAKRSAKIIGRICSEETRAKIRARHIGKRLTPEHRLKLSLAKKGKPSSRKGKTLSQEQRQRISLAKKGKPICRRKKEGATAP